MYFKKSLLLCLFILSISYTVFSQETTNAANIIKEATIKAQKERKQVLVLFRASWCGWCRRMDSLMTKSTLAKTFDKHFVLARITVMEYRPERKKNITPGGMELFAKYGGGTSAGIPYWVVLDSNGKLLANSRLKGATEDLTGTNGDNVGGPLKPASITYFTTVLKRTADFSPEEIEVVKEVFGKE